MCMPPRAIGVAVSVSFDAASEGESAQFGAGPAGQEQPGYQVAYGGPGVDFLGGETFGGQQGAEAVVAVAPLSAGAGQVGPVPGAALGGWEAGGGNPAGCGDGCARFADGVFSGDAVQLHGGRGEPTAVIAEQDGSGEPGGDRCGLGGHLTHPVFVPVPCGGVRG